MASKKQLRELIKTLKQKTGKTQEELSAGAGYGPKTLTQLLSGKANVDNAYSQLILVYGKELKNSTSENLDIQPSLDTILRALSRIENGQSYIRAEIRSYGQYQIQEQVRYDHQKFLQAMDKVGKLYAANLKVGDGQDKTGPNV